MLRTKSTYIDRKFPSHPSQLSGVALQSFDAARMRLVDMDCICTQLVYYAEIVREHIWVLVILRRYVLLDGSSQGNLMRLPEGELENVPASYVSILHCT